VLATAMVATQVVLQRWLPLSGRRYCRPGFTIELLYLPDGSKILERSADFEQAHRAAWSAVRATGPIAAGRSSRSGPRTNSGARARPGTQDLRPVRMPWLRAGLDGFGHVTIQLSWPRSSR
jgi:hypothetical protein